MIKFRKGMKPIALSLAVVIMAATSLRVNAAPSVGSSSKNGYPAGNSVSSVQATAPALAALVAGFEVGFVVGAVVGFVAGGVYSLATAAIGQEQVANLSYIDYKSLDLEKFDNPKN
jgi:hypothetical protein